MRTTAIFMFAFINVHTTLSRFILEMISSGTGTGDDPLGIVAVVGATAVIQFTFVYKFTGSLIVNQNLTLGTGALVAALQIDADMRALAIMDQTLVHIDAYGSVLAGGVTRIAIAVEAAVYVDAFVQTSAIIGGAFIDIDARLVHLIQLVAILAATSEAALCIDAVMAAISVILITLINVHAGLAILHQFKALMALTDIMFLQCGVTDLRTASVVSVTEIDHSTCPPIVQQLHLGWTITDHFTNMEIRCAIMRTVAIIMHTQIEVLTIAMLIQHLTVGTGAAIASMRVVAFQIATNALYIVTLAFIDVLTCFSIRFGYL